MPIKIEITGDNAKTVMQEMFNLCSGVFATYENPPTTGEVEAAGLAMEKEPETAPQVSAPQPKAEGAPKPKEEQKDTQESPFMKYAAEVTQCVTEDQHNELKGICSKFVAANSKNRNKLRTWLTDHKVKRLSELPESLYEEFKKWLEANENAG